MTEQLELEVPRSVATVDFRLMPMEPVPAVTADGEPMDDKEQDPRKRRFRGVANSGAVFRHGPFGNIAVDLSTLEVARQDLPVLRDHNEYQAIGYTTRVEVTDAGLEVEGVLLDVSAARETLELLELGFPMQMSVYVPPTEMVEVGEDEKLEVNGRELAGPGYVLRGSQLREVTLTVLGADENTGAALLSKRRTPAVTVPITKLAHSGQEVHDMSDKTLTAASLREQHPEIVREVEDAALQAERARLSFIEENAEGVTPETVRKARLEGWDEKRIATSFLADVKAQKTARLDAIRVATDDSVGDVTTDAGDDGTADEPVSDVDKWSAEWKRSAKLREEFEDAQAFVAFKRIEKSTPFGRGEE
jgi:hypothetical protein